MGSAGIPWGPGGTTDTLPGTETQLAFQPQCRLACGQLVHVPWLYMAFE